MLFIDKSQANILLMVLVVGIGQLLIACEDSIDTVSDGTVSDGTVSDVNVEEVLEKDEAIQEGVAQNNLPEDIPLLSQKLIAQAEQANLIEYDATNKPSPFYMPLITVDHRSISTDKTQLDAEQKIAEQLEEQTLEPAKEQVHHQIKQQVVTASQQNEHITQGNPSSKTVFELMTRPNTGRPMQPLEHYPLSQLTYQGRMFFEYDNPQGLIQRPDGVVVSVEVGDYVGSRNGRIIEVASNQLHIVEVMLDQQGNRVETAVSLVSPR